MSEAGDRPADDSKRSADARAGQGASSTSNKSARRPRQPTAALVTPREVSAEVELAFGTKYVIFSPRIAVILGDSATLLLSCLLDWLKTPSAGEIYQGRRWIWNTYEKWKSEHFPNYHVNHIRRTFSDLRKMKIVLTRPNAPDGGLYFSIDYDVLAKIIGCTSPRFTPPAPAQINPAQIVLPRNGGRGGAHNLFGGGRAQ